LLPQRRDLPRESAEERCWRRTESEEGSAESPTKIWPFGASTPGCSFVWGRRRPSAAGSASALQDLRSGGHASRRSALLSGEVASRRNRNFSLRRAGQSFGSFVACLTIIIGDPGGTRIAVRSLPYFMPILRLLRTSPPLAVCCLRLVSPNLERGGSDGGLSSNGCRHDTAPS